MIWYLREAFTATLCANLPLTRPLLQHFLKLKQWNTGASTAQVDSYSHGETPEGMIRLRSSVSVVSDPRRPNPHQTPEIQEEGSEQDYEIDSRGQVFRTNTKDIETGYGLQNSRF